MDSNTVTAGATVVLAAITAFYAYLTNSILKEQRRAIKIAALEKKLENIYSPLEEAIVTFILDIKKIQPSNYSESKQKVETIFLELADKLKKVKRNYGHLIDKDIFRYHRKIWYFSPTEGFLEWKTQGELDNLISNFRNDIELFDKDISKKKDMYKIELYNLQGIKSEIEGKSKTAR
jgi:hypothetical protein